MADYYRQIRGLLTGEILGIPKERLEWVGYTEVLELYTRTPVGERSQIVEAMQKIIRDDTDWGVVADTIHLAYSLRISELRGAIGTFREERLSGVEKAWNEVVQEQITTFEKGV